MTAPSPLMRLVASALSMALLVLALSRLLIVLGLPPKVTPLVVSFEGSRWFCLVFGTGVGVVTYGMASLPSFGERGTIKRSLLVSAAVPVAFCCLAVNAEYVDSMLVAGPEYALRQTASFANFVLWYVPRPTLTFAALVSAPIVSREWLGPRWWIAWVPVAVAATLLDRRIRRDDLLFGGCGLFALLLAEINRNRIHSPPAPATP